MATTLKVRTKMDGTEWSRGIQRMKDDIRGLARQAPRLAGAGLGLAGVGTVGGVIARGASSLQRAVDSDIAAQGARIGGKQLEELRQFEREERTGGILEQRLMNLANLQMQARGGVGGAAQQLALQTGITDRRDLLGMNPLSLLYKQQELLQEGGRRAQYLRSRDLSLQGRNTEIAIQKIAERMDVSEAEQRAFEARIKLDEKIRQAVEKFDKSIDAGIAAIVDPTLTVDKIVSDIKHGVEPREFSLSDALFKFGGVLEQIHILVERIYQLGKRSENQ